MSDKYAVLDGAGFVVNVIVCKPAQAEEMAAALGAELTDALPLGLCPGDRRRQDGEFTRNLDGVETVLQPLTPQAQEDFSTLVLARDAAQADLEEAVELMESGVTA